MRLSLTLLLLAGAWSGCSPHPAERAMTDGGQPSEEPIAAPPENWTWVDFPDSTCGNGQPTGLGINPSQRSTDVVISLNGGGACWDATSCFVLKSAVNLESGYTGTTFEGDGIKAAAAFDRDNPENPFRDASFVLVPYCTGDLHAGDRVATYELFGPREVHHRGARNLEAFLRRLASTFPGARRVFVIGTSAGGFGAQLGFHRFAAAFPQAEVHALADCSQMVKPWGGLFGTWVAAWGLPTPEGCAGCDEDLSAWPGWLAATYRDRRFALLAFREDLTLTLYFGYPLDGSFGNATDALLAQHYDSRTNAKYFLLPGTEHTMLGGLTTLSGPGAVPLRSWIERWMAGDPGWVNVK